MCLATNKSIKLSDLFSAFYHMQINLHDSSYFYSKVVQNMPTSLQILPHPEAQTRVSASPSEEMTLPR